MKKVLVNMNPWGRIHNEDCPWLNGHWQAGTWDRTSFQLMPASAAPINKQRCKMCKP
jgi:hypothetical protein